MDAADQDLANAFLAVSISNPAAARQVLEAVKADPATVHRVVSDIPPEAEPVLDYITEVDTRRHLFAELQQLYREVDPSLKVNATVLAFVLVAPIPEIREQISDIRNASSHKLALTLTHVVNNHGPLAMRACTNPHHLSLH